MREGWKISTLGELCKFENGDRGKNYPGRKAFVPSGIPFINAGHLDDGKIDWQGMDFIPQNRYDLLGNGKVQKFDLLFCLRGSLGKFGFVDRDIEGAIASSLVIVRPSEQLECDFLAAYFRSALCAEMISKYANGAAQPNLSAKSLKEFQIPFPPIPEQKRIVAILDEAFAGIDTAIANTEKNLANARELFESYLLSAFENKDENWEVKKWGDLCQFVRGPFGGSLKKSMFKDQGYAVYEQKHAIHDHFNQLRYFIDENKFKEMKRFEVKSGDIIMSCSGVTLGRVAIIPDNIPRGIINQALLKLTPNKLISVHFLKYWLRSKIFQDIIFKHSGGAAIPNVPSAKILKEIVIPLPCLKEQEQIVNSIEMLLTETKRLHAIYQQKLNSLKELKQSLLQKAFSGELTAEADKLIDEAVA
ncbi:restriction endonuclease subunit S [Methylotuvimicrobium sp. KM1]|uniref:restriction endonuclease subunit S n=1 Tax=Methylotuvimicrobium sp. KM1 TaxID=3377707 RepID=UPI0038500D7C